MTAYLLTPAQHSQIVDALSSAQPQPLPSRFQQYDAALAMLKAMQPQKPVACIYNGNQYMRHEFMSDTIPEGSTPLYTLGDTA